MNRQIQNHRKKWLVRAAKLFIVVLLVWFIRSTLVDALEKLDEYQWRNFQPLWLVVAAGLYLLGLLPSGIYWHRILVAMGQHPRLSETLRAYYIGHLGKYVPGKAMVVVLRAGLIRSQRVDTKVAAVSVFLETLTMMAVGAFLAAAFLLVEYRQQPLWMLGAVGLMVIAGLPSLPMVMKRLVKLLRVDQDNDFVGEKLDSLSFGLIFSGWVTIALGWLLLGLSLWATFMAIGAPDELGGGVQFNPLAQLPLFTASVSLAMVAGFLSMIPGGLFVRDAILVKLLMLQIPALSSVAAWVAVLLRIVWLVSEVVLSGILYVGGRPTTQGISAETDADSTVKN